MNKAELDTLREKVAQEPEGSPARLLLAEVDRLNGAMEQAAHAQMKTHFVRDGYTPEEAEKLISSIMADMQAGRTPEMEMGKCRACGGSGHKEESGCFGPRFGGRCPKCNGRGRAMQYKIPA